MKESLLWKCPYTPHKANSQTLEINPGSLCTPPPHLSNSPSSRHNGSFPTAPGPIPPCLVHTSVPWARVPGMLSSCYSGQKVPPPGPSDTSSSLQGNVKVQHVIKSKAFPLSIVTSEVIKKKTISLAEMFSQFMCIFKSTDFFFCLENYCYGLYYVSSVGCALYTTIIYQGVLWLLYRACWSEQKLHPGRRKPS